MHCPPLHRQGVRNARQHGWQVARPLVVHQLLLLLLLLDVQQRLLLLLLLLDVLQRLLLLLLDVQQRLLPLPPLLLDQQG